MKNNYKLHARNADSPLMVVDLCFAKGAYGDFDYCVLCEEGIYSIYLSKKGFKQAEKFGKKLVDKKYYLKILYEIDLFINNLKKLKSDFQDKNFSNKKNKEQWNIVKNILLEFSRLYRYCEQPMLAYFENLLLKSEMGSANLEKLLKNKKIKNKYNLSRNEKQALNILITLGEKKFEIHKNLEVVYAIIELLSEVLCKKFNLSKSQVAVLRMREFEKAIAGIRPSKKKLENRSNGFILLPSPGKILFSCYSGNIFEKWKKRLSLQNAEISGRVAYPGKVFGLVKIHISTLKGQEIPSGSILVSGMTNPQMVPFLKNAVAIITDEGGLTCHAAIISRELKIPCIVGTGNSTQVLHDGDLVEVDANKGIVKIIKKANK